MAKKVKIGFADLSRQHAADGFQHIGFALDQGGALAQQVVGAAASSGLAGTKESRSGFPLMA